MQFHTKYDTRLENLMQINEIIVEILKTIRRTFTR